MHVQTMQEVDDFHILPQSVILNLHVMKSDVESIVIIQQSSSFFLQELDLTHQELCG